MKSPGLSSLRAKTVRAYVQGSFARWCFHVHGVMETLHHLFTGSNPEKRSAGRWQNKPNHWVTWWVISGEKIMCETQAECGSKDTYNIGNVFYIGVLLKLLYFYLFILWVWCMSVCVSVCDQKTVWGSQFLPSGMCWFFSPWGWGVRRIKLRSSGVATSAFPC